MKKILALVLAVLMLTLSACAVAEEAKVMTHEEYAAAEMDSEVTIEAYVQGKQSWWADKAKIYLQDEDGAYFLYEITISEEDYALLVPRTKLRVTGYKTPNPGSPKRKT